MKNTVDLFRIFQHEQKRVGDSMTVYYNIEENSLQYKNTKEMCIRDSLKRCKESSGF